MCTIPTRRPASSCTTSCMTLGEVSMRSTQSTASASGPMVRGERVWLNAGDIVSFPHGHSHWLGSGGEVTPINIGETLPKVLENGLELVQIGGGGPMSRLICGFIACDPQLSQSFLGGLPDLKKKNIRNDPSGQWLENSLRFSVTEAARRQAGSGAVVAKLSKVVSWSGCTLFLHQPESDTLKCRFAAGVDAPQAWRVLQFARRRMRRRQSREGEVT